MSVIFQEHGESRFRRVLFADNPSPMLVYDLATAAFLALDAGMDGYVAKPIEPAALFAAVAAAAESTAP
ncbi:MAG TPA: hypothetical protein VFA27_07010 [Vicinamibacterales bacterium]|nr:hypothetical protein [Vicinamibacterales bacterium]